MVRPESLETTEDGFRLDREMRVEPPEDFLRHTEAHLDVLVDADVHDAYRQFTNLFLNIIETK